MKKFVLTVEAEDLQDFESINVNFRESDGMCIKNIDTEYNDKGNLLKTSTNYTFVDEERLKG